MAITADSLRRLAALNLAPDAMSEVLSIIADMQSVDDARKAKDRDRKRKPASTENPRKIQGSGEELAVEPSEKKVPPHPLKENPLPKENPPKGGQKKGVRLPDDWHPTAADRDYGRQLGFSTSEIDGMAEDLRLWAAAASGQVALKRDWGSAFKGWMRRDARKRPAGAKVLPFAGQPPPKEEYSEAEKARRLKEWRERGFYEATK